MQKWKKENPRKPLFYIHKINMYKNFKFLHEMTCALDHKQFYNGCIGKTQNAFKSGEKYIFKNLKKKFFGLARSSGVQLFKSLWATLRPLWNIYTYF